MKKHLEYTDAKSNKFWEIELRGKSINICYGRIGIENPAKQTPKPDINLQTCC